MAVEAFKYYGGADGAGMRGKYTTPFCNLLINRPVRSDDAKVDYDETGKPIGFGSINFRVRCMGESNGRQTGWPVYPLYEGIDRHWFNERIIDHFYYREIGVESIAQFCHRFESTMQEIMPKYNKMFEARDELFEKDEETGKYKMLFGRYDNWTEDSNGKDKTKHGKTLTKGGKEYDLAVDENKNAANGNQVESSQLNNTRRIVKHQDINNENPEKNTSIHMSTFPSSQYYATEHNISYDEEDTVQINGAPTKNTNTAKGGTLKEFDNRTDSEGGDTKVHHKNHIEHKGYRDFNALEFMKDIPEAYLSVERMIFKDLEPLFMQLF